MYKYFYELDIDDQFEWECDDYRKVGTYDAENIFTGEIVFVSLNDFVRLLNEAKSNDN